MRDQWNTFSKGILLKYPQELVSQKIMARGKSGKHNPSLHFFSIGSHLAAEQGAFKFCRGPRSNSCLLQKSSWFRATIHKDTRLQMWTTRTEHVDFPAQLAHFSIPKKWTPFFKVIAWNCMFCLLISLWIDLFMIDSQFDWHWLGISPHLSSLYMTWCVCVRFGWTWVSELAWGRVWWINSPHS